MKDIMLLAKTPVILKAFKIMKNGAVTRRRSTSKESYKFNVKGSRETTYHVVIYADKKIKPTCDCPYSKKTGKICKHIVATHFFLNPDIYQEVKQKYDLDPECDETIDYWEITRSIMQSMTSSARDEVLMGYLMNEYKIERNIWTLHNLISEIRESVDINDNEIINKLSDLIPIDGRPNVLTLCGEYWFYAINLSDNMLASNSVIPTIIGDAFYGERIHFIPAKVIISAIDEYVKNNINIPPEGFCTLGHI